MSRARKRSASHQITRENEPDDTSLTEEAGTWQKAPEEELAKRKIVSVRRRKRPVPVSSTESAEVQGSEPTAPKFPKFQLTKPSTATPAPATTATEDKGGEEPATVAATSAPAPTTTAAEDKGGEEPATVAATSAPAPTTTAVEDKGGEEPATVAATSASAPATTAEEDKGGEEPATVAATSASTPASDKDAAATSLKDQSESKPGAWKCSTCLLSNANEAIKCIACETDKPGTEEEPTAAPETETKDLPVQSSPKPAAAPAEAKETKEKAAAAPVFSFGVKEGDSTLPTTSSGFTSSTASPFTFGTTPSLSMNSFSSVASGTGSSSAPSFSFLSSGSQSTTFQFAASTFATVSEKTAEKKVPVLKEPEEPLKSGEEDEKLVLKMSVLAYQIKEVEKKNAEGKMEKRQSYVECGSGDLHLNTYTENEKSKARMVLRMDRTHRLALNVPIFKDMKFEIVSDRYVRFTAVQANGSFDTFLLKPKSKAECVEMFEALEDTKKTLSA